MIAPIAVTPGEPAGVGPEILLKLVQKTLPAPLVAIASIDLLKQRANECDLNVQFSSFDFQSPPTQHKPGELIVLDVPLREPALSGQLNRANSGYVLETLKIATQYCLNGSFHALTTGPVHKGIISEAGYAFSGHTEYLAELCSGKPVMMLVANDLRVALATTHLPLKDVSAAITKELLEEVLRILHADLVKLFSISQPRISVSGLNPHAGESGHMGREEIDVIEPVLYKLANEGMKLKGPLPADTLFTPPQLKQCDAVLAMYHDQGLPVLKHVGFSNAVNVTLGLPLIRTSVDHGTALDLAGTGKANSNSLLAAFNTAVSLHR